MRLNGGDKKLTRLYDQLKTAFQSLSVDLTEYELNRVLERNSMTLLRMLCDPGQATLGDFIITKDQTRPLVELLDELIGIQN